MIGGVAHLRGRPTQSTDVFVFVHSRVGAEDRQAEVCDLDLKQFIRNSEKSSRSRISSSLQDIGGTRCSYIAVRA